MSTVASTFVFGSAGQLGRDLVPQLPGTVRAITRADADLAVRGAAYELLERERPATRHQLCRVQQSRSRRNGAGRRVCR